MVKVAQNRHVCDSSENKLQAMSPTGMPHGPHLGPKWAAKWVQLGQPKWDPLCFVRGAHMGPLWACPCVIQVGPNLDPRSIFQLEPTSLPSGSHVSI